MWQIINYCKNGNVDQNVNKWLIVLFSAFDRITQGGSFGMMGKRSFDRLSTSNGNFGMVGVAKRGAFDRLASGAGSFGMVGKRSFDRLDVGSFRMYGGDGKRANDNYEGYDDDDNEQVLWKRAFDRINAGSGFGLKKRASFNIDESPPRLFANDRPFIVYYQPDMKSSIDSSSSSSK